ncbi:peptidylprolyl cis-trans isomerase, FKBP-type [Citrifermentans bemidjiense Bem]|uniref:Peptidyl-prolyl cis-trans isomerase n=1 Tax=Citrifermentans bemidjiense (strain ATCC BAA-1014 / DSM 16622 / JCM 12645 / Bem) TaxID=404380 RepID=B5EC95_CITBB|nr:peptidylprolyl isomerase [Citrifermentans bemidjiense]ACH40551.1 peptidylprolyl cis-trans isomerase, FKBP-type [Citrifermentans bemidjiense Bem]
MAQAKEGDRVKVHYTGKLDDGSIFDSSECAEDDCGCGPGPIEFTIGQGEVIPGFEAGIKGLSVGESKTIHIPVEEAYGERVQEMVAVVPRGDLPPEMNPEVGQQLEVTQEDGQVFSVLVVEVTNETITIDANHPLAGQPLNFELKLVEIL